MRCEYCGRPIRQGDTAHGFKYGTADGLHEAFLPARDSAWTVICSSCSETLYRQIYSKLSMTINPTLYKTFSKTR